MKSQKVLKLQVWMNGLIIFIEKLTMTYDNIFDRTLSVNIKGISMLLIVTHHVFLHYDSSYDFPTILRIVLTALGGLSTAVFFFLSGYGLLCSISHSRPITTQYVSRHLRKIIAPHILLYPYFCCVSFYHRKYINNVYV